MTHYNVKVFYKAYKFQSNLPIISSPSQWKKTLHNFFSTYPNVKERSTSNLVKNSMLLGTILKPFSLFRLSHVRREGFPDDFSIYHCLYFFLFTFRFCNHRINSNTISSHLHRFTLFLSSRYFSISSIFSDKKKSFAFFFHSPDSSHPCVFGMSAKP